MTRRRSRNVRRCRNEQLADLDVGPEIAFEDRRQPLDLRRQLCPRRRATLLEPIDTKAVAVHLPRSLHAATGDDDRRDPTGLLAVRGAPLRRNDVAVLGARTED